MFNLTAKHSHFGTVLCKERQLCIMVHLERIITENKIDKETYR